MGNAVANLCKARSHKQQSDISQYLFSGRFIQTSTKATAFHHFLKWYCDKMEKLNIEQRSLLPRDCELPLHSIKKLSRQSRKLEAQWCSSRVTA